MYYAIGILVLFVISLAIFLVIHWRHVDRRAQRSLDKYLKASHSSEEIGRFYERYIGHLYESAGRDVVYHGAVKGGADLGRDLIVKYENEIHIVQTKCWSKKRTVQEKHIFQLFGSMMHFKLTSKNTRRDVRAVFYTTARYSDIAREVADVLDVELRYEDLDRSYPVVKCNVSGNGEKYYHLPFDPYYDKVKIDPQKGEFFVHTVRQAVEKGFRRAGT